MHKKLLILFIFFSFITHPIGSYETGNVIMRRLTFSDLFGALALIIGIGEVFKAFKISIKVNVIYISALIVISSFFIPMPFSLNVTSSLVEILILIFLLLLSLLIFITFKDELLTTLIPVIINTLFAASLVGFYDLAASMFGLPRIFEQRTNAELTSGFRNAGQAGAYFMVFIALLYPLKQSQLFTLLKKYQKLKLNIAIAISIIFLFSTGKIAAWVGFVIGMFLFAIMNRKIKTIFTIGLTTIILFITFQNLDKIAPDLAKRLNNRVRTRVTENIEGTSNSTFFEKNWGGALKAFSDRPISGTGIGAYYGSYDRYEIHSTYLKMLGETGIIGSIGYLIFIITFILLFKKPNKTYKGNPYNDYLLKMLPFIYGCLVSWVYTYHLRKREFWIMIAILVIVKYQAKLYDYNKKIKL